ncbi:hypothetical protein [Flavobacterium sp. 102]|uniref:hypothetical protein n=1 Tax=Flavobacterium sp. 102 TaxID=2135623 RepID=UPI000EB0B196|nr:hypothetical protein [Flavobacterium sp. 102]RKS00829.1 hypothetical protein C8C84_0461 [Flavobacterium sp. 102]
MKRSPIVIVFLAILISCNKSEKGVDHNNMTTNIQSDEKILKPKKHLDLESFENFPEEIDGPGCVFSLTEKDYKKGGKYIYSDNLDSICYIKIKGDFVRLRLVAIDTTWFPIMHYAKEFRNEDYQLSVDVKKIAEDDEVSLLKGTMLIQYKDQPQEKKELYGFCGC